MIRPTPITGSLLVQCTRCKAWVYDVVAEYRPSGRTEIRRILQSGKSFVLFTEETNFSCPKAGSNVATGRRHHHWVRKTSL